MSATQVRASQLANEITDTDIASANKDGATGTASMRTLGTGATQAAAGNHTHTKSDIGLGNVDNTSDATKNSATATLTNKRITARIQSTASAATVTPNADSDDQVLITAQAAALTLANPSGTPTEGQKLIIRLKDNGTARGITFGAQYRAMGVALPTTTVISKWKHLGLIWSATDSKWDLVAMADEA